MKKICLHCGKEFDTNNPQKLYCDDIHYRPCPVCQKPVAMSDNDFSKPAKCCSQECRNKQKVSRFKEKECVMCGKVFKPTSGRQIACSGPHYATCEICEKSFEISFADWKNGITTCSRVCTKEKMRRNSLQKYGTEHPMQSKIVQEHFHQAMKEKYGVEHALQSDEIKKKVSGSIQNKYGVDWAMCSYAENLANLAKNTAFYLGEQAEKFMSRDKCTSISRLDQYLSENNIKHELEYSIHNRSYDILLNDSNVLLEINPTYTHNAVGNHYGEGLDRNYHKEKTELARNQGFRCINIWDWDSWDSILNLIRPTERKIYARNCTIYKINKNVGDEFLRKYHIQGTCRGQLIYFGLVYEGELVQLMTFGKSRYDKKFSIELLRLCSLPGVVVIGGASKLFNYAVTKWDMYDIISYCDLSKFTGSVYKNMEMKLERVSPPQEIWSKGSAKVTANLLRMRGYDQLFGTSYGKGVSNEELMLKDGWLPVFDCGQFVYSYK